MYGNIYRPSKTMELGAELLELNCTVQSQEIQIEDLRLKAAMYKAYFFHKWELGEILQKQIEENRDACVGEFDGLSYASWRARAIYRTLEDMVQQGMITREDYNSCKV